MFRSFLAVVSPDDREVLRAECELLFTASSKADPSQKYSQGQTLWVGAEQEPRWAVERYALQVFRAHTQGLVFDAAKSGVEFWPLVLDTIDDVGAHYDKDYGAEDDNLAFYPNYGTVTYLTGASGAPTMFFENTEDEGPIPVTIKRGYLSKVVPGKHVRFDGRLLHCASSSVATLAAQRWVPELVEKTATKKRVTLLINVWLDHRPSDPIVLPLEPPEHLSAEKLTDSFSLDTEEELTNVPGSRTGGVHVSMIMDEKRELSFRIPIENVVQCKTSSVAIQFEDGAALVQQPQKKSKAKGKPEKGKYQKKRRGKKLKPWEKKR